MFPYPQSFKLKVAGSRFKARCRRFFLEFCQTLGVPKLKVLAHADESHFFFQSCKGAQVSRNQHASGFVDRKIHGAAQYDALQKTCAVGQSRNGFALLFPAVPGINEKAAVGVTRHCYFERARQRQSLAVTTRHRHAALGIERQ